MNPNGAYNSFRKNWYWPDDFYRDEFELTRKEKREKAKKKEIWV